MSAETVQLQGDLDFETVPALWRSLQPKLRPGAELTLDFSGVDHVNSAAIALILELRESLTALGGSLSLFDEPEALTDLAAVSNLGKLLTGGE